MLLTFPAVSVKGGKFSMDKPSPYNLPIGTGADRVWISVDTNYKPADLNALRSFMETNHMIMLITANEFITSKKKDNALEVHSFSDFKTDVSVTHEEWAKLADFIVKNGVKILIIATLVTTFIGLLIYNLLATFIGRARHDGDFAGGARRASNSGAAMRLTAAARMPYSAIIAAPLMMGRGPYRRIAGWLIWLGYLRIRHRQRQGGSKWLMQIEDILGHHFKKQESCWRKRSPIPAAGETYKGPAV